MTGFRSGFFNDLRNRGEHLKPWKSLEIVAFFDRIVDRDLEDVEAPESSAFVAAGGMKTKAAADPRVENDMGLRLN